MYETINLYGPGTGNGMETEWKRPQQLCIFAAAKSIMLKTKSVAVLQTEEAVQYSDRHSIVDV